MTKSTVLLALTVATVGVLPTVALARETFDVRFFCSAEAQGDVATRAVAACLADRQKALEAFAQRTQTTSKKKAASNGPPRIDVQTTCQTSENEITKLFGEKTAVTYEHCMNQETAALEQIEKNWTTYPAADKAHCVQPRGHMPSYVEWLTCFEIQRDVRRIRGEEAKK